MVYILLVPTHPSRVFESARIETFGSLADQANTQDPELFK